MARQCLPGRSVAGSSELIFQCELEKAGVVVGGGGGDRPDVVGGHGVDIRIGCSRAGLKRVVWVGEVRYVSDVEALCSELDEGLAVDREVLEQRQIDVAVVRTVERVLPFRPE